MNVKTAKSNPVFDGRDELKYVSHSIYFGHLLSWLKTRFPSDFVYPNGTVRSIYFDTLNQKYLNEKVNSDYLKSKIRLRWYSESEDSPAPENYYIEIKNRMGRRTLKTRHHLKDISGNICHLPLEHDFFAEIVSTVKKAFPELAPYSILPMAVIKYERYRFVDMINNLRLSLDTRICAERVNRMFFGKFNPFPLQQSVFEIKGDVSTLPDHLQFITGMGYKKESFSKYQACLEHIEHGS